MPKINKSYFIEYKPRGLLQIAKIPYQTISKKAFLPILVLCSRSYTFCFKRICSLSKKPNIVLLSFI